MISTEEFRYQKPSSKIAITPKPDRVSAVNSYPLHVYRGKNKCSLTCEATDKPRFTVRTSEKQRGPTARIQGRAEERTITILHSANSDMQRIRYRRQSPSNSNCIRSTMYYHRCYLAERSVYGMQILRDRWRARYGRRSAVPVCNNVLGKHHAVRIGC